MYSDDYGAFDAPDLDAHHCNTHKIYIGGLKPGITEHLLREHFQNFGALRRVEIVRDSTTSQSRGFGFVSFYDAHAARSAIMVGHHLVDGKFVVQAKRTIRRRNAPDFPPSPETVGRHFSLSRVDMDQRRIAHPQARAGLINNVLVERDPSLAHNKIFVGGLHPNSTHVALRRYFSQFGPIIVAEVLFYSWGRSRCFGFVIFQSNTSVEQAMNTGPHIVEGRQVEVRRSRIEPRRAQSLMCGDPPGHPRQRQRQQYKHQQYNPADTTHDPANFRSSGASFENLSQDHGVPRDALYHNRDIARFEGVSSTEMELERLREENRRLREQQQLMARVATNTTLDGAVMGVAQEQQQNFMAATSVESVGPSLNSKVLSRDTEAAPLFMTNETDTESFLSFLKSGSKTTDSGSLDASSNQINVAGLPTLFTFGRPDIKDGSQV